MNKEILGRGKARDTSFAGVSVRVPRLGALSTHPFKCAINILCDTIKRYALAFILSRK